ncbi:MAG: hypothetical protein ABIO43_06725, partial [Sphingomicrobium sp.]
MSAVSISAVDAGLPRTLSVRRDDPAFDKAAHRLTDRIDVLLNGQVLPEVASYDVDARTIVRVRRHDDGRPVLDESGLPRHETLRGDVEVRWTKPEGSA